MPPRLSGSARAKDGCGEAQQHISVDYLVLHQGPSKNALRHQSCVCHRHFLSAGWRADYYRGGNELLKAAMPPPLVSANVVSNTRKADVGGPAETRPASGKGCESGCAHCPTALHAGYPPRRKARGRCSWDRRDAERHHADRAVEACQVVSRYPVVPSCLKEGSDQAHIGIER